MLKKTNGIRGESDGLLVAGVGFALMADDTEWSEENYILNKNDRPKGLELTKRRKLPDPDFGLLGQMNPEKVLLIKEALKSCLKNGTVVDQLGSFQIVDEFQVKQELLAALQ